MSGREAKMWTRAWPLAAALALWLGMAGAAWAGFGHNTISEPGRPSAPGSPRNAKTDSSICKEFGSFSDGPHSVNTDTGWWGQKLQWFTSRYNYSGPGYGGGAKLWTDQGKKWMKNCVESGQVINLTGRGVCAAGGFPAGTSPECAIMPVCGTVDECAFDHDMAYNKAEICLVNNPYAYWAYHLLADQNLISCAQGMVAKLSLKYTIDMGAYQASGGLNLAALFRAQQDLANLHYGVAMITAFKGVMTPLDIDMLMWQLAQDGVKLAYKGGVYYVEWNARQSKKAFNWMQARMGELWGGVKDASASAKHGVSSALGHLVGSPIFVDNP